MLLLGFRDCLVRLMRAVRCQLAALLFLGLLGRCALTYAQPPAAPTAPPADWAADYLANDPLANDQEITLDELNAALADEARRDAVIPQHFSRAKLTDDERLAFLKTAFAHPSRTVQAQATTELRNLGWLDSVVAEILWTLAARDDVESKYAAVVALEHVDIAREDAPPAYWNALLESLSAPDLTVREAALRRLRTWDDACVPFLVDAVQQAEPRLRLGAATALSELIGRHGEAAPTRAAADPPQPPANVNPETVPKSRSVEQEPQAARETDDAHPTDVRVYYGTNREVLEVTPDPSVWIFGMPFVFAGAAGVIYLRLRRRRPEAPRRSRLATSLIVLLASAVAIGSFTTWNDAIRKRYSQHVGVTYGPHRNTNGISYGYCDVSIPPTHAIGEVEQALIGPDDEDHHVVLKRTERLADAAFFAEVKKALVDLPKDRRDCFVFIHGYNSTFEQAARRTAQIHYDLKFPGAPIFYSWPSRGALRHYPSDRNEIQYSYRYVKEFLTELVDKLDADRIHIIAHSMGTDAVGRAIAEMGDRGRIFDQIVLAAPDIDADVFREQIAPAMALHAKRTTLYCSNSDWALVASNAFNDGWRAGDASGGIMIVDGADTVDASGIDTALLGHSYYGDCLPLLRDVRMILEQNLPPQERELEAVKTKESAAYWIFRNLVFQLQEADLK